MDNTFSLLDYLTSQPEAMAYEMAQTAEEDLVRLKSTLLKLHDTRKQDLARLRANLQETREANNRSTRPVRSQKVVELRQRR